MNKVKVEREQESYREWFVTATIAHIGIKFGEDTYNDMWIAGGDDCTNLTRIDGVTFRFYFGTRQAARNWARLVNNLTDEQRNAE
jgi:hypothetical protein